MLALLQLAKEHLRADGSVDRDAFKAIYVAPMKALAQEVVSKFQERLKPLGMVVKEYTGTSHPLLISIVAGLLLTLLLRL